MCKHYDVMALGECLIDLTPAGEDETGAPLLACNPGGAPANMLAMCARLGGRTAFIGQVGDDAFGRRLGRALSAAGIDCTGLRYTRRAPTTLAVVHLDENADRSFAFYRKPGADILLRREDVDPSLPARCGIFHFGSLSLTDEPARTATLWAVETARQAGALISYDPNYRPPLWPCEAEAVAWMRRGLQQANLVKVSLEELALLTGTDDPAAGTAQLVAGGALLAVATLGAEGAYWRTAQGGGHVPALPVKAADTTGAGDAFWGAMLWQLRGQTARTLEALPQARWTAMTAFACAAGSLTATRRGAIPAMPREEEIRRALAGQPV